MTPTIADVLGVRLGYRTQGHSAFSRAVRRRRVAVTTRDFSGIVRISGKRWETPKHGRQRRLRQLGSGDWASLYTGIGPHRELVGLRVAGLARAARGACARASPRRLATTMQRPGGIVPAQVAGSVEVRAGRARAAPSPSRSTGASRESGEPSSCWAVPESTSLCDVPEAALANGRNVVEVFEVTGRRAAGARSRV